MEIVGITTRLFENGEPLELFLDEFLPVVREGDIVVLTSKIVALSQGRVAPLEHKQRLIEQAAEALVQTPWGPLALVEGEWRINAGIDESNGDGQLVLFPENASKVAQRVCLYLAKKWTVSNVGVLITDSRSVPLRVGTIGRAVGYFGFKPIRNYVGVPDLFGKKSRVTQGAVADALAAAAVLTMGEGAEKIPLAVIRNAPVDFDQDPVAGTTALSLPHTDDIYRYLFMHSETGSELSRKDDLSPL